MKKILRPIAILLIAALLCVSFAACNTTEPEDKKEIITVGYTIYKPMNYLDDNNELVGFDTDLAKAVFEDLGYTVLFKEIQWEQKYTELEAGTISCIWNGFTSNGEDEGKPRSEYVDFSYNYMINRQVVVASTTTAATITSAENLAGLTGSAEKGSIGYETLTGFEGALVKDSTSQLSALQDLKMGGCDFVVLDEQLALAYVGQGDYADYQVIDALSGDIEYYAIGFKKGSALTAKVNETLEKFAKNGKLEEIATKNNVANAIVKDYSDQK